LFISAYNIVLNAEQVNFAFVYIAGGLFFYTVPAFPPPWKKKIAPDRTECKIFDDSTVGKIRFKISL
jgi:hypothetical protein